MLSAGVIWFLITNIQPVNELITDTYVVVVVAVASAVASAVALLLLLYLHRRLILHTVCHHRLSTVAFILLWLLQS